MDDVTSFSFLSRGFCNVCEIISDLASESLEKTLSWSYFKKKKNGETEEKEFLTTLERLNRKKSSQQLASCVIATRDSLFCKMFSPLFCFE